MERECNPSRSGPAGGNLRPASVHGRGSSAAGLGLSYDHLRTLHKRGMCHLCIHSIDLRIGAFWGSGIFDFFEENLPHISYISKVLRSWKMSMPKLYGVHPSTDGAISVDSRAMMSLALESAQWLHFTHKGGGCWPQSRTFLPALESSPRRRKLIST